MIGRISKKYIVGNRDVINIISIPNVKNTVCYTFPKYESTDQFEQGDLVLFNLDFHIEDDGMNSHKNVAYVRNIKRIKEQIL